MLLAGIIVASANANPLALPFLGDAFTGASNVIGSIAFVAVCALAYRWIAHASKTL